MEKGSIFGVVAAAVACIGGLGAIVWGVAGRFGRPRTRQLPERAESVGTGEWELMEPELFGYPAPAGPESDKTEPDRVAPSDAEVAEKEIPDADTPAEEEAAGEAELEAEAQPEETVPAAAEAAGEEGPEQADPVETAEDVVSEPVTDTPWEPEPEKEIPAEAAPDTSEEAEETGEYCSYRRIKTRLKRLVNRTMRLDPETWDIPSGKKKREKLRRKKVRQYKKARRTYVGAVETGAPYFSEEFSNSLTELLEECGQLRSLLRPLQKGKAAPAEPAEGGRLQYAGDRELIAWLSADILALRNDLDRQIEERLESLWADE